MALCDAELEVLRAAAEAVLPDPELKLDVWAEEHVVIPKGSAFSGHYSLRHTPYARRLLQALSPGDRSFRIVAMVASQMLKTQVFICAALGWIDSAPANIIALEPTDGLAKRLSARFSKAVEVCEPVSHKIAPPRSRDKRNTLDAKEFDGGTIYITTAGADANLAEIPARYVFCDEVDRPAWRGQSSGEGDKVKLAEARTTTYEGIAKVYEVSSPGRLGESKIHELFLVGTQEHYHVPCPHCDHLHELVRENFRYHHDEKRDRIDWAKFVCPECGGFIEEHHKSYMLLDHELGGMAQWVATAPGDGETISVTLSAYYAPPGSITWKRLAQELHVALAAKERGDESLLQVYTNTREGLPYQAGEVTSTAGELLKRAQEERLPARVVPDGACVLTLWVDTQPNRLEGTVIAWGPGLEGWGIEHEVMWGSPTDDPESASSVWAKLDALRSTPFVHASGALIRISAYGIDAGGANTQDVYNYGAARDRVGCIVTRGENLPNRPVIASKPTVQDIDWQGHRVEGGVKTWRIGTDTAKDHLFNRLKLAGGPGALHWHSATDLELFEQLLVEKPRTRFVKGRAVREYVKPNGARNEFLDTHVGNLAVAHYLGLHKWTATDWARLRRNLIGAAPVIPTVERPADKQPPRAEAAPAPQTPPAPPPAAPAPAPSAPTGRRVLSRGLRR
jgi:phage terminase large subunit GpA-like protein